MNVGECLLISWRLEEQSLRFPKVEGILFKTAAQEPCLSYQPAALSYRLQTLQN